MGNMQTSSDPDKERQKRTQESEVLRKEDVQSTAGWPRC